MNEQNETTTSLRRLLDGTLVCPACHSSLRLEEEGLQCEGAECGRIFPIRDGVPIMLIEESEPTDTLH